MGAVFSPPRAVDASGGLHFGCKRIKLGEPSAGARNVATRRGLLRESLRNLQEEEEFAISSARWPGLSSRTPQLPLHIFRNQDTR